MLVQADAFYLPYPSNYFHAVVTSPPYWGLRSYSGNQGDEPLGLESTPELHIERMVQVMREIRRVLRDDGTVWWNYGDCYAGSGGENSNSGLGMDTSEKHGLYRSNPRRTKIAQGSLMLMPHKIAIALQEDGWIVRNDVIWYKRNPMPESVAGWRWERSRQEKKRIKGGGAQNTNLASMDAGISGGLDKVEWEYGDDYVLRKSSWRHTRAHEYVFQFVKDMGYYANQEAVREAQAPESAARYESSFAGPANIDRAARGYQNVAGNGGDRQINPSGRNPRSVLDVPTQSYKGAHYATFPERLIAPLIRASVPRRCCPECGAPWAPVVEKGFHKTQETNNTPEGRGSASRGPEERTDIRERGENANTVTDYSPTCECGVTEHKPGIVLDIFGGSGTTGMVAKSLLRRWVVQDISRPYLDEQAKVRTGYGSPVAQLDGLPMFEEE